MRVKTSCDLTYVQYYYTGFSGAVSQGSPCIFARHFVMHFSIHTHCFPQTTKTFLMPIRRWVAILLAPVQIKNHAYHDIHQRPVLTPTLSFAVALSVQLQQDLLNYPPPETPCFCDQNLSSRVPFSWTRYRKKLALAICRSSKGMVVTTTHTGPYIYSSKYELWAHEQETTT